MALTIKWAPIALENYVKTLQYLSSHWTQKEIKNLDAKLNLKLKRISGYPTIYPLSISKPNLRKARIDVNNYIVYRVNLKENIIEIVNFRGTRQKPVD